MIHLMYNGHTVQNTIYTQQRETLTHQMTKLTHAQKI